MNKTIISIVLAFFVGLNIYAMATGIDGFLELFTATTAWTALLMADLVIALGICCIWIIRDAQKTGHSALGYVILTACTGSVGPLLYLLRRT